MAPAASQRPRPAPAPAAAALALLLLLLLAAAPPPAAAQVPVGRRGGPFGDGLMPMLGSEAAQPPEAFLLPGARVHRDGRVFNYVPTSDCIECRECFTDSCRAVCVPYCARDDGAGFWRNRADGRR
ncbi:MAG: hypothetical protein J3K34DRAFT_42932 [Monoraphidium minutum]|nr:MAG: hypothetical protein J3K34DRAFT_42932 [Monoraphidium minutum]